MMIKKFLLILLTLTFIFAEVYCTETQKSDELKPCKTNQTDQCPPNTSCVQKEKENVDGLCTCLKGFQFNKNFTSNETYCVVSEVTTTEGVKVSSSTAKAVPITTTTVKIPSTSTTTTTTTTTTKAPEKTTTQSKITTTTTTSTTASPFPVPVHPEDGVQKEKVIEPEHMIGGVLLPLLVVATFIGGVFLIRKHNLLERAHNYLTERNWHLPGTARPNYTNDFDEFDDPLLI